MKILVGYRGENIGQTLLQLAAKHAKAFNGEIIVMTSLVGGDDITQTQIDEAKINLEAAQDFFVKLDLPCETHLLVRGHTVGEDIVEYAKEQKVDEIIVGVKSRSNIGKLLFGSTAQYVILRAPCPVTTVR